MTLTEQAIATIAAGCDDWPDLPVTDAELLRIRNECEHNDGQIKIWAKLLQMIVDHVRATRGRLDPATVLALCALAQEALQSRREGHVLVPREITPEMQRAYFDVIDRNMPRVQTDARFGRHDSQIEAYRAMLLALSHPKPESVKS